MTDAAIGARLDELAAALRLMIATQQTHTELLAKIFAAACPADTGGALDAALRGIAGALRDQTAVLERVEAELRGLGGEVEAGVLRGLAQALGVDGPGAAAGEAAPAGPVDRAGEAGRAAVDGGPPLGSGSAC